MEFTTREDIEAPLEQVFAQLTNFEQIERQIMRRGIDVQRTSEGGAGTPRGMSWQASFAFRGKSRTVDVTLAEYDAPNAITYHAVSGGLETVTKVDFVALSRSRTRVGMSVELQPKTLSARLMVQSLKLGKSNLEKRFRVKMAEFAKELEDRLKRVS
ncbi:SRPBCC family protein [Salipiger bermudensis]|uniref:SRPBCC family protein n=1 Tax=Salipiger bermudensis TaxID=344736 RepID=UPI001C993930|nr:SRPBCC family protein [Salipiger bermudensis]MBY6002738.1 SRPBCC family protein [Salipiger bermudensis]